MPPAAKTKVGDLPFGLLLADGRGSDVITRVGKDLQSHDREGVDADDLFQHPASVGRVILPAAGWPPGDTTLPCGLFAVEPAHLLRAIARSRDGIARG